MLFIIMEIIMGTTRVLKTSVYLWFNHLTWLLAQQSYTEFSHSETLGGTVLKTVVPAHYALF